MRAFDQIAEARIRAAAERGEFDDLPGAGRPLSLDEDALVSGELRMAYKVLKNAGFVPEEVRLRRDMAEAEGLVSSLEGDARTQALSRLQLLRTRLQGARGGRANLQVEEQYYQRLLERLARGAASR